MEKCKIYPLRIPIQMCATDTELYVLCTDGSLSFRQIMGTTAEELHYIPNVPGTSAAMAREKNNG